MNLYEASHQQEIREDANARRGRTDSQLYDRSSCDRVVLARDRRRSVRESRNSRKSTARTRFDAVTVSSQSWSRVPRTKLGHASKLPDMQASVRVCCCISLCLCRGSPTSLASTLTMSRRSCGQRHHGGECDTRATQMKGLHNRPRPRSRLR